MRVNVNPTDAEELFVACVKLLLPVSPARVKRWRRDRAKDRLSLDTMVRPEAVLEIIDILNRYHDQTGTPVADRVIGL